MTHLRIVFILLLSFISLKSEATLTVQRLQANKFEFTSTLPPLTQMTGSSHQPFYSYYIDFGDGHIEQGHLPVNQTNFLTTHEYSTQPTYGIVLRVYNNYGQGTPPPDEMVQPSTIALTGVSHIPAIQPPIIQMNTTTAKLKPTFIPINYNVHQQYLIEPNDKLAFLVAYKNTVSADPIDGTVVVLFNEKEDDFESFRPIGTPRTYFNEQSTGNIGGSSLPVAARDFKDALTWEVSKVPPNTEQQMCIDFSVLESNLNHEAKLMVLFIPKGSNGTQAPVNEIGIWITQSRDPNKMKSKLDKKAFQKNKAQYEVHFFNESMGVEHNITVKSWEERANWKNKTVTIRKIQIGEEEIKDKKKIEEICEIKYEKDTIAFYITGVYLNGLQSVDLKNKQEAYGSIAFDINFKDHKPVIKSQSYIQFGTQKVILTNNERLRTQKRFFLGLEIGSTIDSLNSSFAENTSNFYRLRSGFRLNGKTSIFGELGFDEIEEYIVLEGMEDTTLVTNRKLYFNPQVSRQFLKWFHGSAGLNIVGEDVKTYQNNILNKKIEPTINALLNLKATPISTRFFSVDVGGRYTVPLDFTTSGRLHPYLSIRLHIFD